MYCAYVTTIRNLRKHSNADRLQCTTLYGNNVIVDLSYVEGQRVEKYCDGVDPIGKTHIREGVVVRIDNRSKFTAYKHKNFSFKVLEGVIKDTADAPDMEEAEDLAGNQ